MVSFLKFSHIFILIIIITLVHKNTKECIDSKIQMHKYNEIMLSEVVDGKMHFSTSVTPSAWCMDKIAIQAVLYHNSVLIGPLFS